MYIKNAHILEARQHDNKTILCQIRVLPRNLEYYCGQTRPCRTYRWMQAEHWAAFDSGLERILVSKEFQKSKTAEERFLLNSLIQVRLKHSRIPMRTLCHCIAVGNSELNEKDVAFALECIIEYRSDGKWQEKAMVDDIEKNEYEPQPVSNKTDTNLHDRATTSYVPYTPSTKQPLSALDKGFVATSAAVLNCHSDDEYTPITVGDSSSPDKISQTPSPVYNPARIRNTRAQTEPRTISNVDDGAEEKEENRFKEFKERCTKRDKDISSKNKKEDANRQNNEKESEKSKSSKEKRKKEKYREKTENEVEEQESRKSRRPKEQAKFAGTSKVDDAEDFISTYGAKYVSNNNNNEDATDLRRSARSPLKTKRLIEETYGAAKKRSKSKSPTAKKPKTTNAEIFGSDDEGSEVFVSASPRSKKAPDSTLPIIGSITKRRRDISGSSGSGKCEKEKHSMSQWLSKKKDSNCSSTPPPTDGGTKKGRPQPSKPSSSSTKTKSKDRCDTPALVRNYPSTEEMERQICEDKLEIEKNRKLNAMLTEMAGPPPSKVETLTLFKMSTDEIMDSFLTHKPKLVEIFNKLRKKSDVRGHDGIDHYLVIGLVDHNMQLLMMQKLSEEFENNREGSSVFVKLFTNAMMPEWIISIFMDKYQFSRDEAIKQVKGQEEYRLHEEAQLENSIII